MESHAKGGICNGRLTAASASMHVVPPLPEMQKAMNAAKVSHDAALAHYGWMGELCRALKGCQPR